MEEAGLSIQYFLMGESLSGRVGPIYATDATGRFTSTCIINLSQR